MERLTSTPLEILNIQSTVIRALVDLEPGLLQAMQRLFVVGLLPLGQLEVGSLEDLGRRPPRQQVCVLSRRRALLIRAGEVDRTNAVAGDDARRAPLYHDDFVPVLVVVLANVVRRVARADDDGFPALAAAGPSPREGGAVAEQVPLEALRALDVGEVGLARVAGGLDDVARVERPRLDGPAVWQRPLHRDRPASAALVPRGGLDFGAHPYVQLEERGVRLEKVGQLVLGREDGPPVREGQVGQVVVPDGVVENELVVALAPVVAHVVVGVDDEGGHVEHFQSRVRGQTCLAGALLF